MAWFPPARVLARHVLVPSLAPASIVTLYFTPVSLFGCANRGLMAIGVVLVSTIAACVTTGIGARAKARRDRASTRWLLSTLILLLPVALVFGPLG